MKPSLVFIAPEIPSHSYSGLRMRAWQSLLRYAGDFDITLVLPFGFEPTKEVLGLVKNCIILERPHFIVRLALRVFWRLPLWTLNLLFPARPMQPRIAIQKIPPALALALKEAKVVFVFRLYMLPLIRALWRSKLRPSVWLDMDDYESRTNQRLKALALKNGLTREAHIHSALEFTARNAELKFLPHMDRIFVCSKLDRSIVMQEIPGVPVEVVHNVYSGTLAPITQRHDSGSYNILFVGILSYLPNWDGVQWFAQSILPRVVVTLKQDQQKQVHFDVVGQDMPAAVRAALAPLPNITLHGFVADLAKIYRAADVVVCPIRAGGGTRIKILEAVAQGRAVVTTSMGKEGLEFTHDEILTADNEEDFALALCALLKNPKQREALCQKAQIRLKKDYWHPCETH